MYANCVVRGDVADEIMATNKNENTCEEDEDTDEEDEGTDEEDEDTDEEDEDTDEEDEDTDEENANSDKGCRMSTNYDPDEIFDCPLSELFYVAMSLKNLLYNNKGINVVWPPDSHDLSMEEAIRSIPSRLFNFIAWILGFPVEPVEENKVSISVSETCKVVSIAQTLVYLA